jgi:hypothetical protein
VRYLGDDIEDGFISNEDMPMPSAHAIPALLAVLVGLLLCLAVWGIVRGRNHEGSAAWMGRPDGMLLGMLALAAFAMGVFLTYVLLSFAGG